MSKNTLLFWIDIVLFVALMATILTGGPCIFAHPLIHAIPGISLCVVALLHFGLHVSWIKSTYQRYRDLPKPVQSNVRLNIGLFCAYFLCGSLGLLARALPSPFHLHVFLGFIHVFMAALVILLQIIHMCMIIEKRAI